MQRLSKFCWIFLLFNFLFLIRNVVAADVLGPDDVLRISVYGHEDLKTETRVSADGRLSFPLIGEMVVSGKSPIELEETIATRLIDGGFIHDAQVSVVVVEHVSLNVSVLGYVNRPGRYPLDSTTTLVDLIAMAGGTINGSSDSKIWVTRTEDDRVQKYQLDLKDFLEKPETAVAFKMHQSDVVYVPKAPMFYIYGEIQRPGGYPIESDLTVVKALTLGGGLTLRGTESNLHVKRKDEHGDLQEIEVELATPVLRDDVIYVSVGWF